MSDVVIDAEVDYDNEATALQAVERAQVDIQVATAKQYPRSVTDFKRKALAMATADEATAAACFYSLERQGKKIEGPSVRLAEIVGSAWGNMRCEVLPAQEGEKSITMVAMAWDLESNFAQRIPVSRRITGKNGRYGEDMINVTKMAAAAVARRNAIFAVVPRALVADVYDEVKRTAAGKGLTMEQRVERVIKEMAEKVGATEKQTLLLVRRKGRADVTLDDVIHLKGLVTAIADGEISLAAAIMEATGVVEAETLRPKVTAQDVAKGTTVAKDVVEGPAKPQEASPAPPQETPASSPVKAKPEAPAAPVAAPSEQEARDLFK